MAAKFLTITLLASAVALASAQANNNNIPGAKTASAIAASATDGMSRYLAPDGPIQPAITAIGGLPLRAGELANSGITSISSGLNRGAQSFSRAAGQNGQIRMPGLDTAASMTPNFIAQMGSTMQGMIQQKNKFIMGQAERGIEAANRMGQTMRQGLSVRSSGSPMPMEHASSMMNSASEMMSKSGKQIKSQLQQSLSDSMGSLQGMQGIGSDLRNQASGYTRTLSQGLEGVSGQLRQTGQQLMSQAQSNHNKNMSGMGNVLSSLHGSMGQMGQNMQKNLGGLMGHAQSAAQQLSSSLQTAAQAPMNMLSSLGSAMVKGGSGGHGGSSGGSGGRY